MNTRTGMLKNASLLTRAAEFLDRARQVHGIRYGYDWVVYLNHRTPVEIFCRIHGLFSQRPVNHLKGYGCRRCANQLRTTEDFVRSAEIKHGNRYSYDLTV